MSDQATNDIDVREPLIDRTLRNVVDVWRDIAATAREAIGAPVRSNLPREDRDRLRQQMQACLEARGGDVSARARAAELGKTYLGLTEEGRLQFLKVLSGFGADSTAVSVAIQQWQDATTAPEHGDAERTLRQVLEPRRIELLRQFNTLPDGVKFLVDMRAFLLDKSGEDPDLRSVQKDLQDLFKTWFDIGFLELRRITWETPAALLEKLVAYEAVHRIRGWHDLKDRLDSDRRCFAFFHPSLPDEPLIFVEVALVDRLASNIDELLDPAAPVLAPDKADTAIFYSISNCQKGLARISFGDFLIKRVVDQLTQEFPKLRTFATLSPIPGFRRWLDIGLETEGDDLLLAEEHAALEAIVGGKSEPSEEVARNLLSQALDRPRWFRDAEIAAAVKGPLMRLCARYLFKEKRRHNRAQDAVAHFHLSNGARMEQLNWLGDTSNAGLSRSAGIMVNYLYRLDAIEANHEAYSGDGKIVASTAIRALAKD